MNGLSIENGNVPVEKFGWKDMLIERCGMVDPLKHGVVANFCLF